jgi:endonuclease-3 related protein
VVEDRVLADWIRPAGYFNVKTRRLKAFVNTVWASFGGDLRNLFALPDEDLRMTLLKINGIGPETAYSIMLYAGQRPSFVVDAYTRRFMERHDWAHHDSTYDDIAQLFAETVPPKVQLYNEYHALIVRLGKECCRPTPRCDTCPLRPWLP